MHVMQVLGMNLSPSDLKVLCGALTCAACAPGKAPCSAWLATPLQSKTTTQQKTNGTGTLQHQETKTANCRENHHCCTKANKYNQHLLPAALKSSDLTDSTEPTQGAAQLAQQPWLMQEEKHMQA
jgi:hypothetical protein